MNKKNASSSLHLLMLNDLLRTNVIDKVIYDRAVQKINSIKKESQAA